MLETERLRQHVPATLRVHPQGTVHGDDRNDLCSGVPSQPAGLPGVCGVGSQKLEFCLDSATWSSMTSPNEASSFSAVKWE